MRRFRLCVRVCAGWLREGMLVMYYAGDCNAGSKTIAINLPNDERVHALKGTRRLQLRNSMKAKFDKILLPIGQLVVTPEQQKYLNFDAFFWNVTFHEVAHGLGVKQTVIFLLLYTENQRK